VEELRNGYVGRIGRLQQAVDSIEATILNMTAFTEIVKAQACSSESPFSKHPILS